MDIGGPSALKKAHKSVKSKTNKDKLIGKPTTLTKEPKHTLRSRLRVESDISTSENLESELTSIWEGNKIPPSEVQHTQSEPIRAKSISPMACPSGNQNVPVVADVHCSQGGTKTPKLDAQKPVSSSRVPADPPNVDDFAMDDDFTVIKTKKNPTTPKTTPLVTESAINTTLPSSLTLVNQESGGSQHNKNQFLTASRQKIPPVIIHHHFQCDIARPNKDIHTQLQPIGLTTYRMKAGIACQTSTYQDYLNQQTFLKQHKVPFNLIKHNDSKPYRLVIKGIPPTTPSKAIQNELLALGSCVQNVIPMTA
jgi:hypothetical protein